eukprot:8955229-Alexandrium_andersonii.AAC.1
MEAVGARRALPSPVEGWLPLEGPGAGGRVPSKAPVGQDGRQRAPDLIREGRSRLEAPADTSA